MLIVIRSCVFVTQSECRSEAQPYQLCSVSRAGGVEWRARVYLQQRRDTRHRCPQAARYQETSTTQRATRTLRVQVKIIHLDLSFTQSFVCFSILNSLINLHSFI